MDVSVVYITCRDRNEAMTIARALVEARLVACANIMGDVTSLYRWQGAIEEDSEYVVICKTRSTLVDQVIERTKQLHSYECPCVVSWPISKANPDYLNWIAAETSS